MYLLKPYSRSQKCVAPAYSQYPSRGLLAQRRGPLEGTIHLQPKSQHKLRCNPCKAAGGSKSEEGDDPTPRGRHQTPHSMSTIARMSASATGRRHSVTTIRKIGESKRGQSLSASHRAAISAGQKRRHARRRFLVAMEAMHHELIVTCDEVSLPPTPPGDPEDAAACTSSSQAVPNLAQQDCNELATPASLVASAAAEAPAQAADTNTLVSGMCTDEQLDGVQREYRAKLKEYRRLQAKVKPWIDEFEQQNSRKPSEADVNATGDAELCELYQEYQNHRDSLMVEIPAMRAAMSSDGKSSKRSTSAKASSSGKFNSNHSAASHTDVSSRLAAARQYKKSQAVSADSALASSNAGSSGSSSSSAILRVMGMRAKAGVMGGENSRAKAAMLKALEYKKKQSAGKAGTPAQRATGTKDSAVRLVSVEGKAIGGVDYSAVDASHAAAGESQHIKAGSKVESYRVLGDGDGCGLADAFQSMQSSNTAGQVEGPARRSPPVAAAQLDAQAGPAAAQEGQKQPAASAVRSMEALEVLLSTSTEAGSEQNSGSDAGDAPAAPTVGGPGTPSGSRRTGSGRTDAQPQRPSRPSDRSGGATPSVPLAACAAPDDVLQPHTTAAALLELRGKQAAATAAVEAAVAASVAVVAVQTGILPSPEVLPDVGGCGHEHGRALDDVTSVATERARILHAEFECVRRNVMQHLQSGADTYRGGLLFLSRLL